MKKKLAFILAMVMTASVVLAGCGDKKTDGGGDKPVGQTDNVLHLAIADEINQTDPQKTSEYYTIPLNIFDRLVEAETQPDGSYKLVPGLAEKWDISDDGMVYTFHLRKGVKFHNGETLTADDVVYTFNRMMDPATKAQNTDFFMAVKGARAMFDGKADHLEGIKAIDENTVEITLEAPFGPFLAQISTPAGSIFNRKATEAAGDQFGIDPALTVGTGPFKFSEWVLNDHETIVANDDYWGGRPAIDAVEFKVVTDADTQRMMFENGELDEFDCDNAPSQIEYFTTSDKYKDWVKSGSRMAIYYYIMNHDVKPFNDVRVRKAMQMAIDRQQILDTMYFGKGKVESGIYAPGLVGYNENLPKIEYNVEEAKKLLTEAGYPDGFDMEIQQQTNKPEDLQMNEMLVEMLKKVGINATIKQMDEGTFTSLKADGKLTFYTNTAGWSADFNDPDNFIYTFFAPENVKRRCINYKNQEAMQRVVNARTIVDPDQRIKEYQDLEKLVIQDDAGWVPLFSKEHIFIVNPRVENYVVMWNGWSGNRYNKMSIKN